MSDRIKALIALGIFTFMSTLDGSIVNIALPTMSKELHVSTSQITWVVTIYLIVISAIVLIFGRLGDLIGKSRIARIGWGIFILGSALAGLNFGWGLGCLLFGMPGIPCIYYGSEWGEEGVKAPDNDYALRPCFEEPKPNELTDFIKELIEVRRNSDALCNGSYRNVVITNHQLIFERRTDNERVLVAINAGDSEFTAGNGELQGNFTELLANADEIENITLNGQLTMPAYSVQFLKAV